MKSFKYLYELQAFCLKQRVSFVSYCLPESNIPVTIISDQGAVAVTGESSEHSKMTVQSDTGSLHNPNNGNPLQGELLQSAEGFMIMPFLKNQSGYWLNADQVFYGDDVEAFNYSDFKSLTDSGKVNQKKTTSSKLDFNTQDITLPAPVAKETYIANVNRIKESIASGKVSKVVLSRSIATEFKDADAPALFRQLTENRPEAFVYLIALNGVIWLGATPELLLSAKSIWVENNQPEKQRDRDINGNKTQYFDIETMALAGTRKAGSDGPWGLKEIDEQQWVSEYIEDKIKLVSTKNKEALQYLSSRTNHLKEIQQEKRTVYWQKEGPYTSKAGNIEHLRTDFRAQIPAYELGRMVNLLHPTPAVCGWPAQQALEVINSVEEHNRSFYTGFLGPVNMEQKTSLFVNLRCMQILSGKAVLYVGGGITEGSDPEMEWQETNIKSQTLLNEIEKLRTI